VRERFGLPVLTDIHESHQASVAAKAVASTDKVVNVKNGQFLAPWDMTQVVSKLAECGLEASSGKLWLIDRGTSFDYNTLVVDYRSLLQLQALGCPVIFDATHAVQQPGGRGSSSGGQGESVASLARAAMAVGVDGLFLEVHPDPENALSDRPNMVPMHRLEALLRQLLAIHHAVADGIAVSTL